MSHDEASDLLGAYALDAVDGDEFTELEEHLRPVRVVAPSSTACARSRRPWATRWSRCPKDVVPDRPPAARPPRGRGAAANATAGAGGPHTVPGARRRHDTLAPGHGRHRRRHCRGRRLRGGRARHRSGAADDKVSTLQAASPAVTAALRAPGHQLVVLDSSATKTEQAKVVVLPSGQGYLVSSAMPSLEKGQTYQLWAIEGNQPVSLGLLGAAPGQAAFTMAGAKRPTRLSITAEPAGGSV